MKVKLCGFTEEKSLKTAIANKCDFIGFIFYPKSPRNISLKDAVHLAHNIPPQIAKVAVIVDADFEFLTEIYQKLSPDYFQCHGNETPEFLAAIKRKFPKVKIIKAFKISEESDLKQVDDFVDHVDLFLFDGKSPGSGESFNWNLLKNLKISKEWLLSGGLNINNIAEAINITNAKMIDISSGIEKIRGQKSAELITEFMLKLK